MNHIIIAKIQDAATGNELKKARFSCLQNASDWVKSNCKPSLINATICECDQYGYCVGFVEYSSNGQVTIRSYDDNCYILYNNPSNL